MWKGKVAGAVMAGPSLGGTGKFLLHFLEEETGQIAL